MRYIVSVSGSVAAVSRTFQSAAAALRAVDDLHQRQLTDIVIRDEDGRLVSEDELRELVRQLKGRRA